MGIRTMKRLMKVHVNTTLMFLPDKLAEGLVVGEGAVVVLSEDVVDVLHAPGLQELRGAFRLRQEENIREHQPQQVTLTSRMIPSLPGSHRCRRRRHLVRGLCVCSLNRTSLLSLQHLLFSSPWPSCSASSFSSQGHNRCLHYPTAYLQLRHLCRLLLSQSGARES